jgi:prephenate dehydrogenase
VVGYSKSPSTTERARQMGVIDVEAPSALLAVSGRPGAAGRAGGRHRGHLQVHPPPVTPEMLVMDVGSTKRRGGCRAARLKTGVGSFVPCHPITGREVAGVEHADADLYHGSRS